MIKARYLMGMIAILAGCIANYFGDRLLGVQIEVFHGLQGFGGLWFIDMFVLPFFVGVVVVAIFSRGGKWLAYFPPLIVRLISYYEISHSNSIPAGSFLIPMGWWGFFVILVVESAAFGGIMAEYYFKKIFGRKTLTKASAESSSINEGDIKA